MMHVTGKKLSNRRQRMSFAQYLTMTAERINAMYSEPNDVN